PPVREDELDYLDYSVVVLGDAEPFDSPDELDPHRYGVIVTKGWTRGLLLPNLDGVNTVEDQLSIAKQKAGLSPYDDDVQLERFEVVRHTRGGKPRKR
ncbi:MAG: AMMECR1 domain-containing protein, partial [Eggerthellaceae bacterium]|nr:AMMECR1 domain-containing protein [Eggerthellaceae bacterium]